MCRGVTALQRVASGGRGDEAAVFHTAGSQGGRPPHHREMKQLPCAPPGDETIDFPPQGDEIAISISPRCYCDLLVNCTKHFFWKECLVQFY